MRRRSALANVVRLAGATVATFGALAAGGGVAPVARADNCSDPPRQLPDGTITPPGPDCGATAGYRNGRVGGQQVTATGATVLTGTAAGWLLWQRGQLERGPGGKWRVKPGSALEGYVKARQAIKNAQAAGQPVTPQMIKDYQQARTAVQGQVPGFEKFGRTQDGLIGVRIAPGVTPNMAGYGPGAGPSPADLAAGIGTPPPPVATPPPPPPPPAPTPAATPTPAPAGGASTGGSGAAGGAPPEAQLPPELRPLAQGGQVEIDPSQTKWVKNGRIVIPDDVSPEIKKQMEEVAGAGLSTKGGRIIVSKYGTEVEITVQDGHLSAQPARGGAIGVLDSLGAAFADEGITALNNNLDKLGLKIDSLTVDASGKVHVKTVKVPKP